MKGNMMFEPVRNDQIQEYYLKHYSYNNKYMINTNYQPMEIITNQNNKLKRFILID